MTHMSLSNPTTSHATFLRRALIGDAVISAGTGTLDPIVAPAPVSAADLAALPQATTFGTIASAPIDESPEAIPSGRLIHPGEHAARIQAQIGESLW